MMSVANKHPLRKSCTFCRARKIRCSNETICEACRKQNVDCVYDFEPYRPNGSTNNHGESPPTTNESITVQTEDPVSITPLRNSRHCSSVSQSSSSAPCERDAASGSPQLSAEYVAEELEAIFEDNFIREDNGPRSTAWQRKISTLYRAAGSLSSDQRDSRTPASNPGSQSLRYAAVFTSMTEDLVGSVIGKFGNLGCHQVERGGSKFFMNSISRDDRTSMFEPDLPMPEPDSNALVDYGSRKITQTIDVWFSSHPLSFLISKTLLMHELRAGTHDETLVSVLLADAYMFIGDDAAAARSHMFLSLAISNLRKQALDPCTASGSFSPQSTSHRGISTAQALLLLGWNALCRSQIRRATCYISLARRLTTKMNMQKWACTSGAPGGRINGVEVSEVVRETMAYLWCISYTLMLWLYTQVQEFPDLSHNTPASASLPIDASSSALISLDEASDNFSTLQRQKAALTNVWPLAHVSSVVAHIYALYPKPDVLVRRTNSGLWQESALLALQRIQDSSSLQSLDSVCREIHRVLMENASLLDAKIKHAPTGVLVLIVYHTIGIHVLFPRPLPEQDGYSRNTPFSPDIIDRFCASAEEIVKIITEVHESLDTDTVSMIQSQLHPSSPEIFVLALDSCVRAISAICSRQGRSTRLLDFDVFAYYRPKLESLTLRLFTLAEYQFFCPRASLHEVRKQLKAILRSLRPPQSSASTHRTRSESSSSMSRSPLLPSDLESVSCVTPATLPCSGIPPATNRVITSAHISDPNHPFELPIGLQTSHPADNNSSTTILTGYEWEGERQAQKATAHQTHLSNNATGIQPDLFQVDMGEKGTWFPDDDMMTDLDLTTAIELNMPSMMYWPNCS
ncbi:hypothetical protein F5B17DRAFT_453706 [Nemania serpens]|nr:hypothetical protein F5B17DRAFT_453706 [Nemania serpens]